VSDSDSFVFCLKYPNGWRNAQFIQ